MRIFIVKLRKSPKSPFYNWNGDPVLSPVEVLIYQWAFSSSYLPAHLTIHLFFWLIQLTKSLLVGLTSSKSSSNPIRTYVRIQLHETIAFFLLYACPKQITSKSRSSSSSTQSIIRTGTGTPLYMFTLRITSDLFLRHVVAPESNKTPLPLDIRYDCIRHPSRHPPPTRSVLVVAHLLQTHIHTSARFPIAWRRQQQRQRQPQQYCPPHTVCSRIPRPTPPTSSSVPLLNLRLSPARSAISPEKAPATDSLSPQSNGACSSFALLFNQNTHGLTPHSYLYTPLHHNLSSSLFSPFTPRW